MKSFAAVTGSIVSAVIVICFLATGWAGQTTLKKVDSRELKTPKTKEQKPPLTHRPQKPDLTVKLMKITPSSPTTADKIKFQAMIHNDSNVSCPPTRAAIKVGGETRPMIRNVPQLSPNSSWGLVRFEKLNKAQSYRATITADYRDTVQEANEGNNEEMKHFQVARALPDLTVERMGLTGNCAVKLVLRNNGPGALPDEAYAEPAPNGVTLQMYMDGSPFGGMLLSVADPNQRLKKPGGRLKMVWFDNKFVPAGSHELRLVVDEGNTIQEVSEGNNVESAQMTCQ